MKINNKKFAVVLSKVSVIVYVVCSIFVALFPRVSTKLMTTLFHFSSNVATGSRVTVIGVILGIAQVAIYSYIAGMIFAWIFNKSVEK
ncbi:MAG TPA: hypothetical protein DEA43_03105 [Candidatus Moranbacteria bacterium]|nr:hypothetical protein [Candidatus Moranbacteria bacterium]HBT45842.1 hypothetical protein [Candidatus Moranbacteria bacterium]